jgi:hypothetical protein
MITLLFLNYHQIKLFNGLIQLILKLYEKFDIFITVDKVDISFFVFINAYISMIISVIIISFIWYYFTHLCVKLMGGKYGYDQTYKAMTYSLSADYLSLPPYIFFFLSLTYMIISMSIFSVVLFIISTIIYLIPSFYRMYLRLVGLEKLQEISKLRAFIAAYVLAYSALLIVMVIICLIILFILYLLMNFFGFSLPF